MNFIIKKLKFVKDVTINNVVYTANQIVEVIEGLIDGDFINEATQDKNKGINSIDFILIDDTEIIAANTSDGDYAQYLYQTKGANHYIYSKDISSNCINNASGGLDNIIIVRQNNVETTLGWVIDSTKEYFIDGQIDMGTTQITIPSTGITLAGYSFDLSALYSSEDNYTMFVSEVGGSGNVLGRDYEIRVTGTNSQVYDLTDATGFNAFEFARVNYTACTSLGTITNYRQGLESGTGRFGSSPSLTLEGSWVGGYRITTSIVRGMSDTTTEPLFKKGASFTMNSRFLTDINVDLGDLQPLFDFEPANFTNPGTLQVKGAEVTRGGTYNAEDTNITPNIDRGDLPCYWKGNNGLPNTYVGATASVITEQTTTINTIDTYETLAGTFLGTGLEHFEANAAGELKHIGVTPREFEITANLTIEGRANDVISVRFNKWDNATSSFTPLDYTELTRPINSLVGGRDVGFWTFNIGAVLDQNDYIFMEVKNQSGIANVTLEQGSYFRVQER